jgi:Ca2+-binding RTX toxin-like protein
MSVRVRGWPLLAIALVLAVAATAQTSANAVPATKVVDDSRSITPDAMKPTSCTAIALTAKLSGSGTITGASTAELITGSAIVDTISGNSGDDCILGGDGNDSLNGGAGTDVCIGGAGTDTLSLTCETRIQ